VAQADLFRGPVASPSGPPARSKDPATQNKQEQTLTSVRPEATPHRVIDALAPVRFVTFPGTPCSMASAPAGTAHAAARHGLALVPRCGNQEVRGQSLELPSDEKWALIPAAATCANGAEGLTGLTIALYNSTGLPVWCGPGKRGVSSQANQQVNPQ